MNILLLGAAGFIGTNLAIKIAENEDNTITLVDNCDTYFSNIKNYEFKNVRIISSLIDNLFDFDAVLKNQEVVYHLVSTIVPTTSNQNITLDIENNVVFSSKLLEACVKNRVKKVVFISSGGTVYGKNLDCPVSENEPTNPISSYGLQKVMIEKMLYLYNYMYGLDYRVIRLANPYGPYQRPNGVLGAVTTFTYKALSGEEISVYGDGSVIRDYIYIEDAVRGILNIVNGTNGHHVFNLGCGYGISINEVLDKVAEIVDVELKVVYKEGRSVDVPINYLDMTKYEENFGKLNPISLEDGIKLTADFIKKEFL